MQLTKQVLNCELT